MKPHPRLRWLTRVSSLAGLVLIMATAGAVPVFAATGDVWIQPAGTPEETTSGHSEEVHLACGPVDIWADGLAGSSGTWAIYHMPPPPPPQVAIDSGSYSAWSDTNHKIATVPSSVFAGAAGPKFMVTVSNGDNPKSKVFWVDACTSIATTPNPTETTVGGTLNDSATLSGGFSTPAPTAITTLGVAGYQPTGSIEFTLYDPSDTPVHTQSVAVSGNGTYSTDPGFVATVAGTWHWKAAYSGDDWNSPSASLPADEPVVVNRSEERALPSISTSPHPGSAVVGTVLNDTATLSEGSSPTGTILFTLFDPGDNPVHTESIPVDGNGDYSTVTGHAATAAGTWHWQAAYSGDEGNQEVTSLPADEAVTIGKASPAITTTPNPTSLAGSGTLNDSAALTAGYSPTGTLTFRLYDPSNTVVYTQAVTVAGNGTYSTTPGYSANLPGTFHWTAQYSGDANNNPFTSNPADEQVVITAAGAVLASTGSTSSGAMLALTLLLLGAMTMAAGITLRRRES